MDRQSRLPVSLIPASPKVYLQGRRSNRVLSAVSTTMYVSSPTKYLGEHAQGNGTVKKVNKHITTVRDTATAVTAPHLEWPEIATSTAIHPIRDPAYLVLVKHSNRSAYVIWPLSPSKLAHTKSQQTKQVYERQVGISSQHESQCVYTETPRHATYTPTKAHLSII